MSWRRSHRAGARDREGCYRRREWRSQTEPRGKIQGEVAALAETINNMTDTLATFADQVTSVAREVGVDGRLGGQANVPGAAGTWKDLTGNVNLLAANLTNQVRAIAEVATAVTKGDLTRSIQVDAKGEVAELKDNINTMIDNLRLTTEQNTGKTGSRPISPNSPICCRVSETSRRLGGCCSASLRRLLAPRWVIYQLEEDDREGGLRLLPPTLMMAQRYLPRFANWGRSRWSMRRRQANAPCQRFAPRHHLDRIRACESSSAKHHRAACDV